jgi:uncharacterized protein YndB with AHSA1/START domain
MWLKIVLVIVGLVVGVPALLALVGLFLARDHTASMTMVHAAPVERVWGLIADPSGYARWHPGITGAQRLEDRDGHEVWRYQGERGGFAVVIEERVANHRMVTRIVDESAFGGTWTWELEPVDGGTRLTLTERGEVYNPIFRTIGKLFLDQRATIDAWQTAIASALSENVGRPAASG